MATDRAHIGPTPPPEMYAAGLEIDCQCARCGSSCAFDDCCCDGGTTYEIGEAAYPQTCRECRGTGGWWRCLSSPEWCEANPLPGRESVARGKVEWFTFKEHP